MAAARIVFNSVLSVLVTLSNSDRVRSARGCLPLVSPFQRTLGLEVEVPPFVSFCELFLQLVLGKPETNMVRGCFLEQGSVDLPNVFLSIALAKQTSLDVRSVGIDRRSSATASTAILVFATVTATPVSPGKQLDPVVQTESHLNFFFYSLFSIRPLNLKREGENCDWRLNAHTSITLLSPYQSKAVASRSCENEQDF